MKPVIFILSLSLLSALISCRSRRSGPAIQPEPAMQIDSLPGQSPYLTSDAEGNPVLSWVRMNKDSSFVFCYAVSEDQGRSFGNTITIPGSRNIQPHGENLPKIIFKRSGEIIAVWGTANPNPKNKYSGLIQYAQSFDEGTTWSSPVPLVNDTAGNDQRYFDLALLPGGEAGIIWLDNRKTVDREGSALFFASTSGKTGFQKERLINQPCCQCCRTDLFVGSHGDIHVLYRGIVQDSIRDMVHSVSLDDGKTFSDPVRISRDNWVINGCPHTGPAMTENTNGLHFTWFTGGKHKGCFYTNSRSEKIGFKAADGISSSGSHPQITSFSNGKLAITWDESVKVENKFYKRIGFQQRSREGLMEQTAFITADTQTASYPVILSPADDISIVAYLDKKEDKNYVFYRVVNSR